MLGMWLSTLLQRTPLTLLLSGGYQVNILAPSGGILAQSQYFKVTSPKTETTSSSGKTASTASETRLHLFCTMRGSTLFSFRLLVTSTFLYPVSLKEFIQCAFSGFKLHCLVSTLFLFISPRIFFSESSSLLSKTILGLI